MRYPFGVRAKTIYGNFQKILKILMKIRYNNFNFLISFGKCYSNRAFGTHILFLKQFFGLVENFPLSPSLRQWEEPFEARNLCQTENKSMEI